MKVLIGAIILVAVIYFVIKKCGCGKAPTETKGGGSEGEKKGSSCCH